MERAVSKGMEVRDGPPVTDYHVVQAAKAITGHPGGLTENYEKRRGISLSQGT